jgi:RNA polymerase sigma-70 factor (ECF subfamily)
MANDRGSPQGRGPRLAGRPASPEDLARRARRGDAAAFGEIVAHFSGRVYNFLLRRVGNRSDAEELAQEALVRAWEHIGDYDERWRFSTWLYTIASRLAINHHRTRGRIVFGGDLERRESAEPCPHGTLNRRDESERVWAVAGRVLSEAQHTAIWLRYAEDLSIGEIAEVLGKSAIAVRVLLFRAREAIARELAPNEAEAAPPAHAAARGPGRAAAVPSIGLHAAAGGAA